MNLLLLTLTQTLSVTLIIIRILILILILILPSWRQSHPLLPPTKKTKVMRVMTPFPSTLLPNAELRRPSRSFGVLRKMHLIARSLNMWKWQENIRMPHGMIFPHSTSALCLSTWTFWASIRMRRRRMEAILQPVQYKSTVENWLTRSLTFTL